MNNLELSDKAGVETLIRACIHYGMKHVIIAPGSRNAPLTISFVRSELFTCHSIADERAAGFFAIGLACATQSPVAVVCTSGSAVANLAPAMSEAYYSGVPIIAITADRPLEWTDQGNGQTIRQEGIFANFCHFDFSLYAEPAHADESWYNRRMLSKLFNKALIEPRGPVQINVPLREPLYGSKLYVKESNDVFYQTLSPPKKLVDIDKFQFQNSWASSPKVLILVGQNQSNVELDRLLNQAAEFENTIILSETGSNLNFGPHIDTIDRLIDSISRRPDQSHLQPDILISIGAFVVSKKIKSWLRLSDVKAHWHIHPFDDGLDTFQNLSHEIRMRPEDFFTQIIPENISENSSYRKTWFNLASQADAAHQAFIDQAAYSDLRVFNAIHKSLPSGTVLHMANSSPVRYVQLFGRKSDINYQVNRGTSGIDGSTSTAAGWAIAIADKLHVLVTGDIAFLYDSNGLWNNTFPENLKIVVINNGGGGIFRFIEGSNSIPELTEFFETNHQNDLGSVARAFGFKPILLNEHSDLETVLNAFFNRKGKEILEIQTPRLINAEVLQSYFKAIALAIA